MKSGPSDNEKVLAILGVRVSKCAARLHGISSTSPREARIQALVDYVHVLTLCEAYALGLDPPDLLEIWKRAQATDAAGIAETLKSLKSMKPTVH